MDNTHDFVEKLHDTQAKDEKNRQHTKDPQANKTQNKKHSTNK
ncbi:DUF4023 family protein [Paenibacillus sp. N1-5-1-14]|nr:DUF4023 family protein [Paenibacillus radicibacter]MCR8643236.1 DUF4023 family protein [Paenibacillus radicibacter]